LRRHPTPWHAEMAPRGEIDAPCGEIDAPCGEIDAPCGEIDAPCGEIDAPCGEIDAPCGEIDAPVTPTYHLARQLRKLRTTQHLSEVLLCQCHGGMLAGRTFTHSWRLAQTSLTRIVRGYHRLVPLSHAGGRTYTHPRHREPCMVRVCEGHACRVVLHLREVVTCEP